MSVFADASALVKLYVEEDATDAVRGLDGTLVVSQLSRVEVPAALWRKQRTEEIPQRRAVILADEFAADWLGGAATRPRFDVVAVHEPILEQAARLVAVHGLRAYDGVQLASAIAARTADASCATLATFDVRFGDAAAVEGFTVVPQ